MPHIFISYAKKDTQKLAFALCDLFNDMPGMSAWVDRSLKAGRSWEGEIQREIHKSDVFVVLYSPDINRHMHDPNASESYVLEELAYARYTLNKLVIPVMAQMTDPPMGMTRIQYIDFVSDKMSPFELAARILYEADIQPGQPSASLHQMASSPRPKSLVTITTALSTSDILPAPFEWIEIPEKGYSIAKYPLTNAQYARFVEANGYSERKWWTERGWQARKENGWNDPLYYKDTKWNNPKQPIIGVSWYEALAFCLWLSDITGERIMLPTAKQWQYAAQGDDDRIYPWGNEWDGDCCNNSVPPWKNEVTTPVEKYVTQGDSFFGVVDMAGNVWEWCLTDHDNQTNDINSKTNNRTLRGGSWHDPYAVMFGCNFQQGFSPIYRAMNTGFRLIRSA